MRATPTKKHTVRGAALLMALSLLAVFMLLGAAYVRTTALDIESVRFDLARASARATTEAGVQAALANLYEAQKNGSLLSFLGTPQTYQFPSFSTVKGEEGAFEERADRRASAQVVVTDENARINLNAAPPSVLQRILKIDAETARRIAKARPEPGEAEVLPEHAWFRHPSDLLTRNLLTAEQWANVDTTLITTYSGDPADPSRAKVNLNTASPEVLAACLNVPVETVQPLLQRRTEKPFTSVEEAVATLSDIFNVAMGGRDPADVFTVSSSAVRITSAGSVAKRAGAGEYARAHARAEYVVRLSDNPRQVTVLFAYLADGA